METEKQQQKIQEVLKSMDEAFAEYRQKIETLKKEQNTIVKEALKRKEQDQVKDLLKSLS